ncbi:MAG: hypothetical protein K2P77_10315 [Burkholderiaceae bacterium]|nr:hypothetical protein [Burkholderiaceae bacterium]
MRPTKFRAWMDSYPSPWSAAYAAYQHVQRLAAENARLSAEQAWVSSETPPDDESLVLLATSDGDVYPGYIDGGVWRYADAMPVSVLEVVAWRALPPGPPREPAACAD